MGISRQKFDAHKAKYKAKYQNYRKSWPHFLYRHEPIENAIKILRTGSLFSRNYALQHNLIGTDIAPDAVINSTDAAYKYARLYFRPKNPTQYHIEGIRKADSYYQGKHAGLTVMFLFEAASVLTRDSTRFSCGNMQSPLSEIYDGDDGFDKLNFDHIYHDSFHNDKEITRQRCAEVLPQSGLKLKDTLGYIVVRTDADLATLKHSLASMGLNCYLPIAKKTTGSALFFNRHTAVEHIDTSPDVVNFKLAGTDSDGKISTTIQILEVASRNSVFDLTSELDSNTRYSVKHKLAPGNYLINFTLEGVFAHESQIALS